MAIPACQVGSVIPEAKSSQVTSPRLQKESVAEEFLVPSHVLTPLSPSQPHLFSLSCLSDKVPSGPLTLTGRGFPPHSLLQSPLHTGKAEIPHSPPVGAVLWTGLGRSTNLTHSLIPVCTTTSAIGGTAGGELQVHLASIETALAHDPSNSAKTPSLCTSRKVGSGMALVIVQAGHATEG